MSDSESSSSSSSSSSSASETDYEDMNEILSSIGLRKKYGRVFAKANVVDVEDAKDLTEKKLKSIGIDSSADRKKIMRAIEHATTSEDSESSSESESDDESDTEQLRLEKTLRINGLKRYCRTLKKNGFNSLQKLATLDERKLRKLGIDDSVDKRKFLKLAKKTAGLDKSVPVLKYLKRDPSLKKYADMIVKEGKVKTLRDAKRLSDRPLRKLGMKSPKHREKFMKLFAKVRADSEDDEMKAIARILTKAKLKEYVQAFVKFKVDTLEKAADLDSEELKLMGVDSLSERNKIMRAFRKSKSDSDDSESEESSDDGSESLDDEAEENEAIYKVLKTINFEKYTKNFTDRDIRSVRAAQELGHNELKDLGFNHIGQRDLIINAFQEADWKCIYCHEWNEFRKTCINCAKARRAVDADTTFAIDQKVKYIGKFRPTTRIKYGDKGEIHRVLADEHYMVKIKKSDRIIKIRLRQDELAACS